jgi:hypothetical protein
MQGGSTKVYKKGYQGETLNNLIVGHPSLMGFQGMLHHWVLGHTTKAYVTTKASNLA